MWQMFELHPLTVALGTGNFGALIVVVSFLWRWDKKITLFMIEHQMLLDDYCQRKGIKNLPTRRYDR